MPAFFLPASAQSTLEFANGSGPATSGSTIANQVITFKENVNNPLDNGSLGAGPGGVSGSVSLQSVAVMSVDGRQMQQNSAFVSGGSIDLSRYAAGVYFLAIRTTAGQVEVVKILKN